MPIRDINVTLVDTEGGEFDLLNTDNIEFEIDLFEIPNGPAIDISII